MEGGLDGDASVKAAFAAAEALYRGGYDFDFIDFESIERAALEDGRLCVSGEAYRAVVVPAMRTIRYGALEKLAAFAGAGGLVLLEGALPEASDHAGRSDPALRALVEQIVSRCGHPQTAQETLAAVRAAFPGDLGTDKVPFHLHRRIDGCDVFFLYGAKEGTVCRLRGTGEARLFDPWTGEERPVPCLEQDGESTLLRLPLAETQAQVLVFSGKGEALRETEQAAWNERPVEGAWGFELLPTLDNRYGDYEQPPYKGFVGAQARFFRFSQGEREKTVTRLEEAYLLKLGPMPQPADDQLLALGRIAPGTSVSVGGKTYAFSEYTPMPIFMSPRTAATPGPARWPSRTATAPTAPSPPSSAPATPSAPSRPSSTAMFSFSSAAASTVCAKRSSFAAATATTAPTASSTPPIPARRPSSRQTCR